MSVKGIIKRCLPDSIFLKIIFKKMMGYSLNLRNPCTFNEKLQWLKLYNRNPLYTTLVDKYAVKKWVADKIGCQYVIPTLGVWSHFDDIDFDSLPNQFVLKCTHDSGGLVICKDKNCLNKDKVKKEIEDCLKKNFYYQCREWPYKNVPPLIIAEKYMEDEKDGELRDYKFYTFNGEPKFLLLATNRQSKDKPLCFDYFDMEFNHLPLTNHWHPNNEYELPHKPFGFEQMKDLARALAKNIPHVRVDFYEVNGQIYFGEMTFFDMGGFLKIHPNFWEREWGDMIALPEKKRG
jgi:hypothetical protein